MCWEDLPARCAQNPEHSSRLTILQWMTNRNNCVIRRGELYHECLCGYFDIWLWVFGLPNLGDGYIIQFTVWGLPLMIRRCLQWSEDFTCIHHSLWIWIHQRALVVSSVQLVSHIWTLCSISCLQYCICSRMDNKNVPNRYKQFKERSLGLWCRREWCWR